MTTTHTTITTLATCRRRVFNEKYSGAGSRATIRRMNGNAATLRKTRPSSMSLIVGVTSLPGVNNRNRNNTTGGRKAAATTACTRPAGGPRPRRPAPRGTTPRSAGPAGRTPRDGYRSRTPSPTHTASRPWSTRRTLEAPPDQARPDRTRSVDRRRRKDSTCAATHASPFPRPHNQTGPHQHTRRISGSGAAGGPAEGPGFPAVGRKAGPFSASRSVPSPLRLLGTVGRHRRERLLATRHARASRYGGCWAQCSSSWRSGSSARTRRPADGVGPSVPSGRCALRSRPGLPGFSTSRSGCGPGAAATSNVGGTLMEPAGRPAASEWS